MNIKNIVRQELLREFTKKERVIKNPDNYMRRLAKRGKLTKVGKFQDITVRDPEEDEIGQEKIVYKRDPEQYGYDDKNIESRKVVNPGDRLATNVGTGRWNEYPIDPKTFGKKYYQKDDNAGTDVYSPTGEDMYASPALRRGVRFKPKNWGGYEARVGKGGRMMQSSKDPSDIYPITGEFYNSTYRPK